MKVPTEAIRNSRLSIDLGRDVLLMDALAIGPGSRVHLEFQSASPRWRHGLFLATDGLLRAGGQEASQFTVWTDTAPKSVTIVCGKTKSGVITIYNVWDGGTGLKSQAHTSGMLLELCGSWRCYSCQDVGTDAGFDDLKFRLWVAPPLNDRVKVLLGSTDIPQP